MAHLVSAVFPQDTTIQSFLQKTEAESKDIEVLCTPSFTKNGNQEQIVFNAKVINHSPYPIPGDLVDNTNVFINDTLGLCFLCGNGVRSHRGNFIAPNDSLNSSIYSLDIKNNRVYKNNNFINDLSEGKTEITAYTTYKGRRSKRLKINIATKSITEIN
jgi:hypothetical protein